MTATATIVHTSSREQETRDRIARVSAAGRVEATRRVREAREAAQRVEATQAAVIWVEGLRREGAVTVGFKICTDEAKFRMRTTLDEAVTVLVHHWGGDVEAWGITADSEFVGEGW